MKFVVEMVRVIPQKYRNQVPKMAIQVPNWHNLNGASEFAIPLEH